MRLIGLCLLVLACNPRDGGDEGASGDGLPPARVDDGDDNGDDGLAPGDGDGAPPGEGGDPGSDSGGDSGNDSGGDSGDTGTPAAPALSHAADVQPIWDRACTRCHDSGGDGGLSLTADNAYDELVNGPASQADMPLVTPGDPSASYLWHKLEGSQDSVGGGGETMPEGDSLSSSERATIEQWIAEGAAP
jgi:hypothetical protein